MWVEVLDQVLSLTSGSALDPIEFCGEQAPPHTAIVSCTITECTSPVPGLLLPAALNEASAARVAEYTAGRVSAAAALRLLTGEPSFPGAGVDSEPIWPLGTVGSISHAGGVAVAIVGLGDVYRGVGIDIEPLLTTAQVTEIRTQIISEMEWSMLCKAYADERVALTVAFSAKESLYKAIYPTVGRFVDFREARLVGVANDGLAFQLSDELVSETRLPKVISVSASQQADFVLTNCLLSI